MLKNQEYFEQLPNKADELKKLLHIFSTVSQLGEVLAIEICHLEGIIDKCSKSRYLCFTIPKKSGKKRVIYAPLGYLMSAQKRISLLLGLIYSPPSAVHGYVKDKSIITNARKHQYKTAVLNIDLEDFFSTIKAARITNLFTNIGFTTEGSKILADLLCYDGYLPQGSPASPTVSNMICLKMDRQLTSLAKKNKLTYTRYGDDITFSTTAPGFPSDFEKDAIRIIKKSGFKINQAKYRLQTRKSRQEVTGLTVNEFPNIQRRYIRYIKTQLHYWSTKGVEVPAEHYNNHQKKKAKTVQFTKSLRGKIEFVGMVRGKDDKIYKKLLATFNALNNRSKADVEPLPSVIMSR